MEYVLAAVVLFMIYCGCGFMGLLSERFDIVLWWMKRS